VRHFLDWPSCNTVRAILGEARPGTLHQNTAVVTAMMIVRRRGRAGAWFQLLRSYLNQCDAVNRKDRHLNVERNEFSSRRPRDVTLRSGFSAVGGRPREPEGARGRIQLGG